MSDVVPPGDVRVGDILHSRSAGTFEVAEITTPDWDTYAFHGADGEEVRVSDSSEVSVTHQSKCRNCDGRKCMGCVCRQYDHDCRDDCPDCCPAPPVAVSYPGGTQWAVRRNDIGQIATDFADEDDARYWLAKFLECAQKDYPNDQSKWPELVCAEIVWRAVQ